VSLPAIMKHLDVLSEAGLVTRKKVGRTVTCQLKAEPMEQAMNWLAKYERYWTEQLDRLAAFVEDDSWQASPASPSSAGSKRRPKKSTKPGPSRKNDPWWGVWATTHSRADLGSRPFPGRSADTSTTA
jgi:hypothetical protein